MRMAQIIIFTGTSSFISMRAIGAYQIANVLRKSGYTVQVIEYFPHILYHYGIDMIEKILEKFIDKSTLWIGFSTTFFFPNLIEDTNNIFGKNVYLLKEDDKSRLKNFVKRINPDTKWVSGGAFSWKVNDGNNLIDCFIEGYAEESILNYTKSLHKKAVFFPYRKNLNGSITINYDRKGDLFNFTDHTFQWDDSDFIDRDESLPIEISRGCIFRCKFCAYPLNGKKKFDYIKDPKNLYIEFLKNYEKFGTTNYMFSDDTYNDSVQKVEILYDEVFSKLPFKINWASYIRLDLLAAHPSTIELIRDSGIKIAFFGIESLNYQSNKTIGKGMPIDKIIETLKELRIKWKDVVLQGGFILGLPGDSEESITNWSELLLSKEFPLDNVVFTVLKLNYDNSAPWVSEIEKNPESFGYTFYEENGHKFWKNNMDLTEIQAQNIYRKLRKQLDSKEQKWGILTIPLLNQALKNLEEYRYPDLMQSKPNNVFKNKVENYLSKILLD